MEGKVAFSSMGDWLPEKVARTWCTADVALYLNRRLRPFTALNSWTGGISTGCNSWTELHLNRGLPGGAVYDLSAGRH
jgi:hypothetical protein